jgi:tetratricopeptide (TPR) repeat protein
MKKTMIAAIIALLFSAAANAKNNFKDGNKSYLDGQYDAALSSYGDFIKERPKYYEGYFNAGDALFRNEQYEDALEMFKKALELKPKDENIQYNINLTEQKLKEQQKNNKDRKNNKKDKKDSKDGKNGKDGKDGKSGKDSKDNGGKSGNQQDPSGKNGKDKGSNQQNSSGGQGSEKSDAQKQKDQDAERKQKLGGMSEDEAQAIMNMTQKDEKQLRNRGYFGNQQQNKQMPNPMNMTPEQLMQYMMQMNGQQPPQQQAPANTNEKNW